MSTKGQRKGEGMTSTIDLTAASSTRVEDPEELELMRVLDELIQDATAELPRSSWVPSANLLASLAVADGGCGIPGCEGCASSFGPPPYITEAGLERLDSVLSHAKGNPRAFDQSRWMRASVFPLPGLQVTACVAGWTCLMAGATPLRRSVQEGMGGQLSHVTYKGVARDIPGLARELLEADRGLASLMFAAHNTLQDVHAIRDFAAASRRSGFSRAVGLDTAAGQHIQPHTLLARMMASTFTPDVRVHVVTI